MNKNDEAWEKLFEKYRILEAIERRGAVIISANQIKEFREPRLMTKFDHSVYLPYNFSKEHLAILPISRGDYLISSFEAYHSFPKETVPCQVQKISIPPALQSLHPQYISSEAIALNCAYASGVLSHFFQEDKLYPTISGRMGSGTFQFNINSKCGKTGIEVANAQIEIDAGYEGQDFLSLIEAKCHFGDDFIIRQLYYPVRTWNKRVRKQVKPVFLIYSNGSFHLFEYAFSDLHEYNSIQLVRYGKYVIETQITRNTLERVASDVMLVPEPTAIPFPLADKLERVINLLELLNANTMTKDDISSNYEFVQRQSDYYTNAGRYLGLFEKFQDEAGSIAFQLTPTARKIMQLGHKERQLALVSLILQHKVFSEAFKFCVQHQITEPPREVIVDIMKQSSLDNFEDSTYWRRASTVIGWIKWIFSLAD